MPQQASQQPAKTLFTACRAAGKTAGAGVDRENPGNGKPLFRDRAELSPQHDLRLRLRLLQLTGSASQALGKQHRDLPQDADGHLGMSALQADELLA